MRFCCGFRGLQQLGGAEKRPQAHSDPREGVCSALLAIDHTDRRSDLETRLAQLEETLRDLTAKEAQRHDTETQLREAHIPA